LSCAESIHFPFLTLEIAILIAFPSSPVSRNIALAIEAAFLACLLVRLLSCFAKLLPVHGIFNP
jgi:hypothetical protein